jgi:hypothetical protein
MGEDKDYRQVTVGKSEGMVPLRKGSCRRFGRLLSSCTTSSFSRRTQLHAMC